jgi:signal transduction histidine kinase
MGDDERRRIAPELHDGVGQLLAAISMNNAIVQEQSYKLDSAAARAFSENISLVEQINREIRTLSHLLHPATARCGWSCLGNSLVCGRLLGA